MLDSLLRLFNAQEELKEMDVPLPGAKIHIPRTIFGFQKVIFRTLQNPHFLLTKNNFRHMKMFCSAHGKIIFGFQPNNFLQIKQ